LSSFLCTPLCNFVAKIRRWILDIEFLSNFLKISWPRLENDEYIMAAGSVRPLMDAFWIAHVEMVKWLESEYGFDRWEALQVFSQVGEAQVANVVDPNYTVIAKFPKKYLPLQ
jgi:amidase